jgi:hypothetical protein
MRAEPGLTADFADVRIATTQSPEPSHGTGRIVAIRNAVAVLDRASASAAGRHAYRVHPAAAG